MKRYEVYYKDDFGNVVPALDQQADDGEWVLYEDAQAEITQLRLEFRLAEEGLANYAQEVQQLKARAEVDLKEGLAQEQEIERLRKDLFMAHAELCEGSACGCFCDDCKAYMTGGSSEPQPAEHK